MFKEEYLMKKNRKSDLDEDKLDFQNFLIREMRERYMNDALDLFTHFLVKKYPDIRNPLSLVSNSGYHILRFKDRLKYVCYIMDTTNIDINIITINYCYVDCSDYTDYSKFRCENQEWHVWNSKDNV